jgi:hypothetical protein
MIKINIVCYLHGMIFINNLQTCRQEGKEGSHGHLANYKDYYSQDLVEITK